MEGLGEAPTMKGVGRLWALRLPVGLLEGQGPDHGHTTHLAEPPWFVACELGFVWDCRLALIIVFHLNRAADFEYVDSANRAPQPSVHFESGSGFRAVRYPASRHDIAAHP